MFNRFRTEGYNGYSVAFSPFFENKVAVASAANFGIVGNGRLWVLGLGGGPPPRPGMAPPQGMMGVEKTWVSCRGQPSLPDWSLGPSRPIFGLHIIQLRLAGRPV